MTSTQTHANGKAGKPRTAVPRTATKGHGARPDRAFVGLCVIDQKGTLYLRLALRAHHLKSIGDPKRIDIRGTLQDGLLIAPGKQVKPYAAGRDLFYANIVLPNFDSRVPQETRAQIWMRPEVKGGHVQLPGCPAAWIAAEGEYKRGVWHEKPRVFEGGHRDVQLSPFAGDDGAVLRQDARKVEPPAPPAPEAPPAAALGSPEAPATITSARGVTAPAARPTVAYQVPDSLADLESVLSGKLGEVRALIRAMEERTGLQLTLDRNLRVAVNLRERPNK